MIYYATAATDVAPVCKKLGPFNLLCEKYHLRMRIMMMRDVSSSSRRRSSRKSFSRRCVISVGIVRLRAQQVVQRCVAISDLFTDAIRDALLSVVDSSSSWVFILVLFGIRHAQHFCACCHHIDVGEASRPPHSATTNVHGRRGDGTEEFLCWQASSRLRTLQR